jgi:hypothetical protein
MCSDQFASAMQARLHCCARDPQRVGDFVPGLIFDIPQLVDGAIQPRECGDGIVETLLHLAARKARLGCRIVAGEFAAFFVESRKLEQGQQGFSFFQLPAHTAADLRQPCAECLGIAELVEMTVGFQQSLDENVLSTFMIATDAQQLTVNGIFVLAREGVEIGGIRPARVERHKDSLAARRCSRCIRDH